MSIKQINPYILFNGTGEKAIKLYQGALGAEVVGMMRYGDAQGCKTPPEHKDFVMHAALRIGEGSIMISDVTPDRAVTLGGNVEIAMHFTEVAAMEKAFEALGAGGKVTIPPQDMFWGARFGALTDAYGVRWMFNCELKKA